MVDSPFLLQRKKHQFPKAASQSDTIVDSERKGQKVNRIQGP